MASFFQLTLDTTAPTGIVVSLNDNALYTANRVVKLKTTLAIDDGDGTNYQMKIWGIDSYENESSADWETYVPEKSITLTDGDELKTVHVKVRDDVGNESTEYTAQITLKTTVPVVTVSGPNKSKISKVSGYDEAIITFTVDVEFAAYKVCLVSSDTDLEDAGTVIGTTHGSIATSGNDGNYPANQAISVTINGADLYDVASSDGVKIIKVFAKDTDGIWSVT